MFTHSLSANQAGLSRLGVKKSPQASPRFAGASTAFPSSQRDSFQKTAQQTATPVDGAQPVASPLLRQAQPLKFAGRAPLHTPEELLRYFEDPENQKKSVKQAAGELCYSDELTLSRNLKPLIEAGYLEQNEVPINVGKCFKTHHLTPDGVKVLEQKQSERIEKQEERKEKQRALIEIQEELKNRSVMKDALEEFVDNRIEAGYYQARNKYTSIPLPENEEDFQYFLISDTERNPEQYASEEVKDAYCAWKKIPRESIQEGGKGQKAGEHFFEFSEFLRGVLRKTQATGKKNVRNKFRNMTLPNK